MSMHKHWKNNVILSSTAKVGGWIGLVVGASLISFVEFIYFTIQLIRTSLKKKQVTPGVDQTDRKEYPAAYNPPA